MVEATSQHEFKIFSRHEIAFRLINKRDTDIDRLYACLKLNKRFKWQALLDVSQKNLVSLKKGISNYIKDLNHRDAQNEHPCIEIKNAIGNNAPSINGVYQPMVNQKKPSEPHYPYKRINGVDDKYLYCTKKGNDWIWWLGNRKSFLKRKAWGWCHEKKGADSPEFDFPWTVGKWLCLTNQNGQTSWVDTGSLITKLTQKNKIKNEQITFMVNCENKIKTAQIDCENKVKKATTSLNDHQCLSTFLFNNISKEQRKNIMEHEQFKGLFKKKDLCPHCFESAPTTPCIHHDCIGACEKCWRTHKEGGGGDGSCFACGKEQKKECPICTEDHDIEYLNVLKCNHVVCWKCFCTSYQCNRPLKTCPMCRKPI